MQILNKGDIMERINEQRISAGNIALMAIGWISAILSLFIYPFIFGVV